MLLSPFIVKSAVSVSTISDVDAPIGKLLKVPFDGIVSEPAKFLLSTTLELFFFDSQLPLLKIKSADSVV
nr:hypothetical protein [Nonlabens ulvanivorans]